MKGFCLLLLVVLPCLTLAQNQPNKQLEDALNKLALELQNNPQNPLKVDQAFLSRVTPLLNDENLRNVFQRYSTNIGSDKDLSYRQVYFDLSTAFGRTPSLASNAQFNQTKLQLDLMFDNYGMLAGKLKSVKGNYQFGTFLNDAELMSNLQDLSGSYENALAIGMGVELFKTFTEGLAEMQKFRDDYRKLSKLSADVIYAEQDDNLNGALIDAYVGITSRQMLTPVYRYDFDNGASLQVENGILKYINSRLGVVKNLIVVERRHDGNFYRSSAYWEQYPPVLLISKGEKSFYLHKLGEALNDSKCNDCMKDGGYLFNAENGSLIFSDDAVLRPKGIDSYSFNENGELWDYRFLGLSGNALMKYEFKADKKKAFTDEFKVNKEGRRAYNMKNIYYGSETVLERDGTAAVLFWLNVNQQYSTKLVIGSHAEFSGTDVMLNELTGIVRRKGDDLFFVSSKGFLGRLPASSYKFDDPAFSSKIRAALTEKIVVGYNFLDDKQYETVHGNISRAPGTPLIPRLEFTPDEKKLVYVVNDSLYLINPDNFKDVRRFGLTINPYGMFFTKENGDWVLNFQALNEYKFPVIKKYNMRKLWESDTRKKAKPAFQSGTTTQPVNANSGTLSLADEISKLKALLDQGVITQDEFNQAKKKLLEGSTTTPVQNSPTSAGDGKFSNWLFIHTDKALQFRFRLQEQRGNVNYYQVQFRINFDDQIYCTESNCLGYLLAFGYADPATRGMVYRHFKFYNDYKEIYTMPELVPVQVSFSNGQKRELTNKGFYIGGNGADPMPDETVFYNCVDNMLSNMQKHRCAGPGSYRDLFIESQAVILGGQPTTTPQQGRSESVTPQQNNQQQSAPAEKPKKKSASGLIGGM